ncbi:MAG: hypothetical protein ABIJ08_00400 [Nanoarchaeota archaeon]
MKRIIFMLMIAVLITACNPLQSDECNALKGETNADNCYFEKAISTADAVLCENIKMDQLKGSCISEIGIALNDIRLCESLDNTTKGYCYAKIAINNEDETICESIDSTYWIDICYSELGKAKNDAELCLKVDIRYADACFVEVAESTQDEGVCRWITDNDDKYFCYRDLALSKEDVTICNNIADDVWRDGNCIKKYAEVADDPEICETIGLVKIKEHCLEKFKE